MASRAAEPLEARWGGEAGGRRQVFVGVRSYPQGELDNVLCRAV